LIENNTLPLTDLETKAGITEIYRTGTSKNDLSIHFIINGYESELILPTNDNLSSTYNRLKKRLEDFLPYKTDEDKDYFKRLQQTLEITINKNFNWMCGKDIRAEKEGFKENNSNSNNQSEAEQETKSEDDRNSYVPVTVHNAVAMHSGLIQFEGVISSIDTTEEPQAFLKKAEWKCYVCGNLVERPVYNMLDIPSPPKTCSCENENCFENCHEYINSRLFKLQSEDNFLTDATLELLPVYVLEDDINNIQLSSKIRIYGKIHKRQNPKTKQFYTVVVAKFVDYKDRRSIEITEQDKCKLEELSKSETLEQDLTNQFAKQIIGLEFEKLSIILSAVGGEEILHPDNGRVVKRGRINILIIGPPGFGKTELMKEANELRLNSKYVSGTNTTGGSLTSMVVLENGQYVLRLGAAALAVKGFLGINEFDKLKVEHQNCILEVMEEGESILNKYAFLKKINAQTTVIASANPVNGDWVSDTSIQAEELPFPLQILSRFDAIIVVRRQKTKEEALEFAKMYCNRNPADLVSNNDELRKYIELTHQVRNITINPDAYELLNNFFANLVSNKHLGYYTSNRNMPIITRYAEAFARLRLTNVVTKEIAQQAINHIEKMLDRLNIEVAGSLNPRFYTYGKFMNYIQNHSDNPKNALALTDVAQRLRIVDETINAYIGDIIDQVKI